MTSERLNGRGIQYGPVTRISDERASAEVMQHNANAYRRAYRGEIPSGRSYEANVADAAYCASLAERKAREQR